MAIPPGKAARKSAAKSRNGCITCRIRRVKCDEARPVCARCTSTQRRCDGFLPDGVIVTRRSLADLLRQTSAIGPASEALVPILQRAPQQHATPSLDAVCFDFFREITGPGTASVVPSPFWTRDVLQIAHSDPAVWHAALAVGAIHRQWEGERHVRQPADQLSASGGAFKRRALAHYFRAISLAKTISDVATLRALSIVLVAASNVLGRWSDSQTHLLGGLRLLEREQERGGDVDSAAEVLERLDIQAMTFSVTRAPYPYQSPVWLHSLHKRLHGPQPIASYSQAGTLLITLLRRFILISANKSDGDPSSVLFNTLIEELKSWESKMQAFEDGNPREELPALSIRLYHAQLRVWLAASFDGAETRFDTDQCLFYFERIVLFGERLYRELDDRSVNPLSLEPASVTPLFWTAHRCRHPQLRRRAARVLRESQRMEGMWSSDGTAFVADRIIAVEEDSAGISDGAVSPDTTAISDLPDVPWDTFSSSTTLAPSTVSWKGMKVVPESRRAREVLVRVDYETGQADIRMLFPDPLNLSECVYIQDTVYFWTSGSCVPAKEAAPRPVKARHTSGKSSTGWCGTKRESPITPGLTALPCVPLGAIYTFVPAGHHVTMAERIGQDPRFRRELSTLFPETSKIGPNG